MTTALHNDNLDTEGGLDLNSLLRDIDNAEGALDELDGRLDEFHARADAILKDCETPSKKSTSNNE